MKQTDNGEFYEKLPNHLNFHLGRIISKTLYVRVIDFLAVTLSQRVTPDENKHFVCFSRRLQQSTENKRKS